MRSLFVRETNPDEWQSVMTPDAQGMAVFFYSAPGMYLLYSYSGIYLVIEGFRDLGLKDQRIDELLESPFVDRLRLFRNATFHYQKEPSSCKHLQFFGTEEERTEVWLNDIYREFERFFQENTLPVPERLRAELKDKTHAQVAQSVRDYWASERVLDESGE